MGAIARTCSRKIGLRDLNALWHWWRQCSANALNAVNFSISVWKQIRYMVLTYLHLLKICNSAVTKHLHTIYYSHRTKAMQALQLISFSGHYFNDIEKLTGLIRLLLHVVLFHTHVTCMYVSCDMYMHVHIRTLTCGSN